MTNKQLQQILQQYPEDIEILFEENCDYYNEVVIGKDSLYHFNYTSKFQSNVDYYSKIDEVFEYKDLFNGKIVEVKVKGKFNDFLVISL